MDEKILANIATTTANNVKPEIITNFQNKIEQFYNECNIIAQSINSQQTVEEITNKTAILIFNIREFFTGQQLQLIFGGYADKKFQEVQIPLLEALEQSKVSYLNGKADAIKIPNLLTQNIKELQQYKKSVMHQWEYILKYGIIKNKDADGELKTTITYTKKGKPRNADIWRKRLPDIGVYAQFENTGEKNVFQHYYIKEKAQQITTRAQLTNQGIAYDKGWLFQWIKTAQRQEILFLPANHASELQPLIGLFSQQFSNRENLPGVRGGDDDIYQYKYDNKKIIAVTNIKNIICGYHSNQKNQSYFSLKETLEELKQNIKNSEAFIKIMLNFLDINQPNIVDFIQKRYKELTGQSGISEDDVKNILVTL